MKIDLHTHSNLSDGTDTPAELVTKAAAAGLDIVALTDHDTFDGLAEASAAAADLGIELIGGIELSCRFEGVGVHVLGYDVGPSPELDAELVRTRASRADRLPEILRRLAAAGFPLTSDEVKRFQGKSPSLGRPHIADAMVARGYVANRNEAFRDWLAEGKPAYFDRYATELEQGIDLIAAAGGAPVIAHPWSRQARKVLTPAVIEHLARGRLVGIEVDHPDHDPSTRAELMALADENGLVATGSSDYHGLGKTNNDLGCDTTSPEAFEALKAHFGNSAAC